MEHKKHNKLKFNKFVKKVYYDSTQDIKYIISQRVIDGMLKITIIDNYNKSEKHIIKRRKDEDFFFYYDLFDKGVWIAIKNNSQMKYVKPKKSLQQIQHAKMKKAEKQKKKELERKDKIQVLRF